MIIFTLNFKGRINNTGTISLTSAVFLKWRVRTLRRNQDFITGLKQLRVYLNCSGTDN